MLSKCNILKVGVAYTMLIYIGLCISEWYTEKRQWYKQYDGMTLGSHILQLNGILLL